jgi:hypothetical protein
MVDFDMRGTSKLAALLTCAALATSRVSLVAHELVGHGGVALALGAHVTRVRLFYFAGGWIRYDLPDGSTAATLAIAMAGVAVELVLAGVLAVAAWHGDSLARRLVRGIAAALVVHATWYLANGAWSGFGDGVLLYRVLAVARVPFAIAIGAVAVTAAYLGAREALGALAATLNGRRRGRVAGVAVALAVAAGVHGGLTMAELALRRDPAYASVMRPEAARVVARELAAWTAAQPAPPSREAIEAREGQLEEQHKTLPFGVALAIACAIAASAGAVRARPLAAAEVSLEARLVARFAGAATLAVLLVVMLDALLGSGG